jgi:hypothetical protein
MTHIIIIRMKFSDKELFQKYLKISKEILSPSLKSQTNKNFIIGCIICEEDIELVKNHLDLDFIPFKNNTEFIDYVNDNNINIQTRHDMDDYMSSEYIQRIQEIYIENIEHNDVFLIHSQPIKLMFNSKEEIKMDKYNNNRISMFVSLCQKKVKNHIFSRKHGQMYEIAEKIILLPEGYTKWVIHGDNISVKKNMV